MILYWNSGIFENLRTTPLQSQNYFYNRWIPKNKNNYVEKRKYTDSHMERILSKGVVKLIFFEGNMDSVKYIDILKSFFDEMYSISPNGWILQ